MMSLSMDSFGDGTDPIESLGLINVNDDSFAYLDDDSDWFCPLKDDDHKILSDFIDSVFDDDLRYTKMGLVNKFSDLIEYSPSKNLNTRTFTRPRKSGNKRESLFNGNITKLQTLYSNDDSDDYNNDKSIAMNKTFEIKSAKKVENGAVNYNGNNNNNNHNRDDTFSLGNAAHYGDMNDLEEIARIQEEALKLSCRSPSRSPTRSPIRHPSPSIAGRFGARNSVLENYSNTITKKYSSLNRQIPSKSADALVDDISLNMRVNNTYDDDYDNYHDISPEPFIPEPSHTSTPFVLHPKERTNRNVNFTHDTRQSSQIMPNVSNLRSRSPYGVQNVGRSLPNLTKRLATAPNGIARNEKSKPQHYAKPLSNQSSRIAANSTKMAGDSRLLSRNGIVKGQTQTQSLSRMANDRSPPLYQRQQPISKVMGDSSVSSNKIGTANLIRKSTFRVRNAYNANSEENLYEDDDYCPLHSNPNTVNGNNPCNATFAPNTNIESFQKPVHHGVNSKIPGPKTNRSAIPVCGTRTAIPTSSRTATNHPDNSWRNGCF